MLTYQPKIAFRDMRASDVRDVLIYCRDHRCSHHVEISADRWPDHVRLSDIEPDFVCTPAANVARSCGRFAGQNGDRLKHARWCIKSVHASASRRFGNERDRGNFRDLSSPMEN
jgi:hypothetical protein